MTTLNVPRISRKKAVEVKYEPSSYRVFGEHSNTQFYRKPQDKPETEITQYDKTLHLPSWYYNSHYEPSRNNRFRDNCTVTYLRRNVKTLNQPVGFIPSKEEAPHWWPNRVPPLTKPDPAKTKDSTMRADYNWNQEHEKQGTMIRHMHNTQKPAVGIVPVNWLNDGDTQKFYKEKMSYEHQYDSRNNTNYPMRCKPVIDKRHGAFIEEPVSSDKAMNMLNKQAELSGWRTDTQIRNENAKEDKPMYSRQTEHVNAKIRSNFDIAPRSNLNVRVREYIPSVPAALPPIIPETINSAPPSLSQPTNQTANPSHNTTAVESEPLGQA